jgi:hypothetical protein
MTAKKGDRLELACAKYFQGKGYLVRRGVKLLFAPGVGEATDVDLLALRFHDPSQEERVVVDCRDRQRSKPFERVLWTAGLVRFSGAQRGIVVSASAGPEARQFGMSGGVELIFSGDIEANVARLNDRVFFSDADQMQADYWNRLANSSATLAKDLREEVDRVRNMWISGNEISNFNRCLTIMRRLGARGEGTVEEGRQLLELAHRETIVAATLMLVRFVTRHKWYAEKDWTNILLSRLTYGDVPPEKARELVQIAFRGSSGRGLPPPEFADELIALIQRLMHEDELIGYIPLAMDALLSIRSTMHDIPEDMLHFMPPQLRSDAIKLCRKCISTFRFASGTGKLATLEREKVAVQGRTKGATASTERDPELFAEK